MKLTRILFLALAVLLPAGTISTVAHAGDEAPAEGGAKKKSKKKSKKGAEDGAGKTEKTE
jgi:hypothetical protein